MIYRIARIAAYAGRQADLRDEGMWLDFLDDFGPALSRFLIDPDAVASIPTSDPALAEFRRSLESNPIGTLKPRRESVWMLFAFKGEFARLPPPFRQDGVLLPFEWRRKDEVDGLADGARMPAGLVALADGVRQLFGAAAEGWVLRPDRLFWGQVDFNLSGATFESGWGALATGLARALDGRLVTGEWPFSSIAWNSEARLPASVGELARKFRLAADFGAEEFAVAPEQRREAERILAEVKANAREIAALRCLRIFNWRYDGDDFDGSVRRLCRCNAYHGVRRLLRHVAVDLAVFAAIFTTVGALAWYATRETVEYYADYVEDGGGVRGLFRLAERPRNAMSYEFRRRGWESLVPGRRGERLLRSVSFVNARGEPREDVNDLPEHRCFATRTFAYDERGALVSSRCFGAGGRFLGGFRYSGESGDTADAVQGGNRYIDGYAFASGGDRVRRLRYVRDAQGRVAEIRFSRDSGDVAAEDATGVSRVAFRRDAMGRIVSVEYRDWRGDAVSDQAGIHRVEYAYEGASMVSLRRFAANGTPVCGADGGDEIAYEYSSAGSLRRRVVCAGGTNICSTVYGTDAAGDCVSERHFGHDGKPRREPWFERRIGRDAKGNLVLESWFNADGRPLPRDSGHPAAVRRAYGESGSLREEMRLDERGLLLAGSDGWARRTLESHHSETGTMIDRRYFGEDGRPTLAGRDRIAGERKRFDEAGRLVGWKLFGISGEPVEGTLGWHRAVFRYDREGRREQVELYDRNGGRIK